MLSKEFLLNCDLFIDNEWLDKYVDLINNNSIESVAGKTEDHHIIPKFYFRANNLDIDNSDTNIVTLLYCNHVLAHYFLCKMLIMGDSKYSLSAYFAVFQVFNNRDIDFDTFELNREAILNDLQTNYENLHSSQEYSIRMSNSVKNFYSDLKLNNPEKYELWKFNHKVAANKPEVLEKNKLGIKEYWDNMSEEEYIEYCNNKKEFWVGKSTEERRLYNGGANGNHNRNLITKCIETNTIYKNTKEAAEWLMTITNWAYSTCKGKIKLSVTDGISVGGYHFVRLSNYKNKRCN